MEAQSQIKRRLSDPEMITHIQSLVHAHPTWSRQRLARHLCESLDFLDARGRAQVSCCAKALTDLHRFSGLALPETKSVGRAARKPSRVGDPIAEPVGIPSEVGSLQGLQLVLVETREQLMIWNELVIREHPLGHCFCAGYQMRYLVDSEHGWLGAVGFSAAALKCGARDQWIGWNSECRRSHLNRVLNMYRFLIRPSVRCANLASRVLGMCARSLPDDFRCRYNFDIWLMESFVDANHYSGTCYQAANWEKVGQTKGRGRHDRYTRREKSIKDIYIYPLIPDFRGMLGLPEGAGATPLRIDFALSGPGWAKHEIGAVRLGDRRLDKRLIDILELKGENPAASWPEVIHGDPAAVVGYYRLIGREPESSFTMESILTPHGDQTIRRLRNEKLALVVHDTTDLNYGGLQKCEGLGRIGQLRPNSETRGLRLHSALALNVEGLPLGILHAQCEAPRLESKKKTGRDTRYLPIEGKETFRWIEGLRKIQEMAKGVSGQTRILNVMDREADFFELFDEWNRSPCCDLLIRAKHDRRTDKGVGLLTSVQQSPLQGCLEVSVPRQSARKARGKKGAIPKRHARKAQVEVRFLKMALAPPEKGLRRDSPPIDVTAIHAKEINPPDGGEPVKWSLITTLSVNTIEEAKTIIGYYCLRWRIEDWHRVLKSGCKVERLSHETADRLKRVIAMDMVIAWRIMLMALLGREHPELPPDVLFSEVELKILTRFALKKTSNHHLISGKR